MASIDDAGVRFGATPAFSDRKSGLLAAQIYSDGPTLDAPDCVADNP
jgi:hypothetical protein